MVKGDEKKMWDRLYNDTIDGSLPWKTSSESAEAFFVKMEDNIILLQKILPANTYIMINVFYPDGRCDTLFSGLGFLRKSIAKKLFDEVRSRFGADVLESDVEFFREHGLSGPRPKPKVTSPAPAVDTPKGLG